MSLTTAPDTVVAGGPDRSGVYADVIGSPRVHCTSTFFLRNIVLPPSRIRCRKGLFTKTPFCFSRQTPRSSFPSIPPPTVAIHRQPAPSPHRAFSDYLSSPAACSVSPRDGRMILIVSPYQPDSNEERRSRENGPPFLRPPAKRTTCWLRWRHSCPGARRKESRSAQIPPPSPHVGVSNYMPRNPLRKQ